MEIHKDYLRYAVELSKELLQIHSPGGYTVNAIDRLKKEFDSLGIKYTETNKGAIYGTIEGKNTEKHRVVSAHADTLGAMVRQIKPNGCLKLAPIGGIAFNSIEGETLYIITRTGKIITGTGLPEKASVHIFENIEKEERNGETFEVRLDADTSSKEETLKLGINVGDFVAFEPRTVETPEGYIKSRHLDDKACIGMMFAVCKYLKEKNEKPAYTTHFFISNYEEIGHGFYGIPKECFEVLAVDIGTVGGLQNSDEHAVTIIAKDSRTPYDFGFRHRLEELAIKNGINYRTDVMFRYGSDASMYVLQGFDINFACAGPGVSATHHYERTHLDAFKATIDLIYAYTMEELKCF
ncbi:M42 family metallopeptidase [Treponema pedis]|uniref:M42 family metallopeptidase n=1 Tax=Treponema pedis TaxID=409322 RepID=UPI000493F266|nr:M42 family metallopeptidase [Treponema pedis]